MKNEIKYPFRIGVEKIEYFNEEIHQNFKNDFDGVYNLFLVELDQLMYKWGVRKIEAYIGMGELLQRDSAD